MVMIAHSHRVFWLSLWLGVTAISERAQAALTPEKLYQRALPSVMKLEVENEVGERFVGSAVLALKDDVALTAWHVVSDARSVWATFADGQRVKVIGCIDHDGLRDLALLKLEKQLPHRRATLCRQLQPVAARAYVIGAPKGFDFSISDGLISQIREVDGFQQYQLSCPISPGNSGSPILNNSGEVIGIASWTKSDAQNVSFAIPAREFVRLNISKRPTSWEDLPAASPARLTKSHQNNDRVLEAKKNDGSFTALLKRLHDSAGRPVTVVVQEEGRTNSYSFIAK